VHYASEAGITQIFLISDRADVEARPDSPIKLLEVNRDTMASGIMPLQFGPAPTIGVPFPSVIVEVTPEELVMIQSHQLQLPSGWTLGSLLPRSNAGSGE
jgi:hypothetical protein